MESAKNFTSIVSFTKASFIIWGFTVQEFDFSLQTMDINYRDNFSTLPKPLEDD